MRKFIFLIGSTNDFESIEELEDAYFNDDTERNMSVFPVEIDPATRITGYDTIEEIATMIGRGMASSNDWCMDGTFSTLLEA